MISTALGAASDIDDLGLSPYQINGDPVTALIAQLNRFAGKAIKPGPGCPSISSQVLLAAPLPLIPALDPKGADTAWLIAGQRYSCAPQDTRSPDRERWIDQGSTNTWAWALNNLTDLTKVIAAYGDSLGLDAAKVGITQRDPNLVPKFPWVTVTLIGLLAAAGGTAIYRRSKR